MVWGTIKLEKTMVKNCKNYYLVVTMNRFVVTFLFSKNLIII